MEYRNKETGIVIDVNSVMAGDWEPVKAKPAATTEKKETKSEDGKGKAKK